jgi:4a-hydroxytetrahydrobiopterin dehydratase
MMQISTQRLSEVEVNSQLVDLPAWTLKYGKLHREYQFQTFALAIGFMVTAAVVIQKKNHHPEWFNIFNRVVVDLTTHDSGGITQMDFDVAALMEQIWANG